MTAKSIIDQAVDLLQRGELVAFPTETVYGLGADASNPAAIAKLYAAKGRPANHPVIVHIADLTELSSWARIVPGQATLLAEKFWPGPLTLILPKAAHVRAEITGGQDSVGLRVPAHPLALELLKEFGGGVIAPSANKFGRLSPTRAEDVRSEFKEEVSLVLDGGPCGVGIESTIVDLTGDQAVILRPGMIDQLQLEAVIGPVKTRGELSTTESLTRVSGDLPSHYAPRTPLYLLTTNEVAALANVSDSLERVAVLAFLPAPSKSKWIVASADPHVFARELYRNLRQLDHLNADRIIVETPPSSPDWAGICDRLKRAAK